MHIAFHRSAQTASEGSTHIPPVMHITTFITSSTELSFLLTMAVTSYTKSTASHHHRHAVRRDHEHEGGHQRLGRYGTAWTTATPHHLSLRYSGAGVVHSYFHCASVTASGSVGITSRTVSASRLDSQWNMITLNCTSARTSPPAPNGSSRPPAPRLIPLRHANPTAAAQQHRVLLRDHHLLQSQQHRHNPCVRVAFRVHVLF